MLLSDSTLSAGARADWNGLKAIITADALGACQTLRSRAGEDRGETTPEKSVPVGTSSTWRVWIERSGPACDC